MQVPDSVIRSARFQLMPAQEQFANHADRAAGRGVEPDEPWCPDHGYGCEPQNCPCGHSLRCDCVQIQNEH